MTTAMNNPGTTNTNGSTNGTNVDTGTKKRAPMTAVDAIGKIGKILDLLPLSDRKRVIAFVSEGLEAS